MKKKNTKISSDAYIERQAKEPYNVIFIDRYLHEEKIKENSVDDFIKHMLSNRGKQSELDMCCDLEHHTETEEILFSYTPAALMSKIVKTNRLVVNLEIVWPEAKIILKMGAEAKIILHEDGIFGTTIFKISSRDWIQVSLESV